MKYDMISYYIVCYYFLLQLTYLQIREANFLFIAFTHGFKQVCKKWYCFNEKKIGDFDVLLPLGCLDIDRNLHIYTFSLYKHNLVLDLCAIWYSPVAKLMAVRNNIEI